MEPCPKRRRISRGVDRHNIRQRQKRGDTGAASADTRSHVENGGNEQHIQQPGQNPSLERLPHHPAYAPRRSMQGHKGEKPPSTEAQENEPRDHDMGLKPTTIAVVTAVESVIQVVIDSGSTLLAQLTIPATASIISVDNYGSVTLPSIPTFSPVHTDANPSARPSAQPTSFDRATRTSQQQYSNSHLATVSSNQMPSQSPLSINMDRSSSQMVLVPPPSTPLPPSSPTSLASSTISSYFSASAPASVSMSSAKAPSSSPSPTTTQLTPGSAEGAPNNFTPSIMQSSSIPDQPTESSSYFTEVLTTPHITINPSEPSIAPHSIVPSFNSALGNLSSTATTPSEISSFSSALFSDFVSPTADPVSNTTQVATSTSPSSISSFSTSFRPISTSLQPTLSTSRYANSSTSLASSTSTTQTSSVSSISSSPSLLSSASSSLSSASLTTSSTSVAGGSGAGSTVSAAPSPSDTSGAGSGSGSSNGPPTSTLVGSIVGGVAGLALIVLLFIFLLRRRKNQKRQQQLSTPGAATIPPSTAQSGGGVTQRSSGVPIMAAGFLRRMRPNSGATATTTETSPSERGFQNFGGRRLESVLRTGGDGYAEPSQSRLGPGSPTTREGGNLSASTFYRDSQGFYGGEASAPTSMYLAPGSSTYGSPPGSPSYPAPAAAGLPPEGIGSDRSGGETAIMRPGPARTPVTTPAGFASFANPRRNLQAPRGAPQPRSVPSPAPAHPRDGVGRSHPSYDGSRGSRFTEEV